ncbi:MAG: efflux RND transporter permease subunit, partial [Planctomycetota bacterium]
MLNIIVEFILARRAMVLAVLIAFLGTGAYTFHRLNIEAYPDPAPPYMEIISQNAGQSAEEIERYISIPIEIAMAGMPGLQNIRSTSLYGLSDVRVQFSYDTEYKSALQEVLNRLSTLAGLPSGVQPSISGVSPIGEICRYQIIGPPGCSLTDLKTLQDWVVEKRFRTIPGVVDITGWGGLTKQYHVDVELEKLTAYHIPLSQVVTAISNSNMNVGASTLDLGQQSANVRGLGLIRSLDDLDNIVLTQQNGTPVLLKDVARPEIGHTQRLGIAGRDNDPDVVFGTILMRRGSKTLEVLGRVEAAIEDMNHSNILPAGVQIKPYYNRRDLIGVTTHTVLHNLVFGLALIFLIQFLFLGDLRSAIVVCASIPFALFFSAMIMYLKGDSANLLSVGSIDFGIIVDATVIMVENIFRRLAEGDGHLGKRHKILSGATEVGSSVFFSTAIIIAAFLPLFTMQGVEGQIFGPMAQTYGYAM